MCSVAGCYRGENLFDISNIGDNDRGVYLGLCEKHINMLKNKNWEVTKP
jgi:hypothetical protein